MKKKNRKFREWLKSIDLDDVLPIAMDVKNAVEGKIFRINLGNISKKVSPTGNWQYLPFQVRYKTQEKAEEVRLEILKTIFSITKPKR